MKFDIYGRLQWEVIREGDHWVVYWLAPGKRILAADIVVPPEVTPEGLATYLDDLFHEGAAPEKMVRPL